MFKEILPIWCTFLFHWICIAFYHSGPNKLGVKSVRLTYSPWQCKSNEIKKDCLTKDSSYRKFYMSSIVQHKEEYILVVYISTDQKDKPWNVDVTATTRLESLQFLKFKFLEAEMYRPFSMICTYFYHKQPNSLNKTVWTLTPRKLNDNPAVSFQ